MSSIKLPLWGGRNTLVFTVLAVCLYALFSFTTVPTAPPAIVDSITLPIEVMGEAGAINSARFTLEDTRGIDQMYLKIHRPAYRDVATTDRGAKASYRMNREGKWIDITPENVEVYPHEKEYGGLTGTYFTIRMNVPVSNLKVGGNRVYFRFNGTDGVTSGYRILEFNLLKAGKPVLRESIFHHDDPESWTPYYPAASDIRAGKKLWETAKLRQSPLNGRILPVTCGDCHAQDGRDLKYFNYSDASIVARSNFHGLSTTHGRLIASYIRSLDAPAPEQARPWNPPYQPGPGLDKLPLEEWAAGAGLEWVLEDQDEEADYLLGARTRSDFERVISINSRLNVRQAPIAMQLPDWNAWLPHEHPGDLLPDAFYRDARFRMVNIDEQPRSYQRLYEKVREKAAEMPQQLTGSEGVGNLLDVFATQSSHFHGGNSYVTTSSSLPRERQRPAIAHWSAVKQWEIMHTYGLEDKAKVFFPLGEKRSWLSDRRNVFEMAPHRSAEGGKFSYQSLVEGKYLSTAWYQLQLVINAGNKGGVTLAPNDWNYLPDHINGLHRAGGPAHAWRYVFSFTKMLQHFHDKKPVSESGIGFRQLHPARYLSNVGTLFGALDPETAAKAKGQLLNATMDLLESHDISEWPRTSNPTRDNDLRPSSYVPRNLGTALNILQQRLAGHHFADAWMTMIPIFQSQGIDCAILRRAVNWGKQMWPNGAWDSLIDDGNCTAGAIRLGEGTGLRGQYFSGMRFEKKVLERVDPTIRFSWGVDKVAPEVPKDYYSVRWEGYVQPLYTGKYTFETRTDEGCRLWVDKQLIVNEWRFQHPTKHTGEIELVAGVKYAIKMEYLEHVGGATAALRWSSKFQPYEIIPQTQLYPLPLTSSAVVGKSAAEAPAGGKPSTDLSVPTAPGIQTEARSATTVFPNPTSGMLRVSGGAASDEYYLYDPFGRLLQSGKLGAINYEVDLSQLTPAIYTLRVGEQVHRVVRQ